jgi:hypothetical protein
MPPLLSRTTACRNRPNRAPKGRECAAKASPIAAQAALIRQFDSRWAAGAGVRFVASTGADDITSANGARSASPAIAIPERSTGWYAEALLRYDVNFAGDLQFIISARSAGHCGQWGRGRSSRALEKMRGFGFLFLARAVKACSKLGPLRGRGCRVFHEEGEEGRRGEPNFAKQSIFLRP